MQFVKKCPIINKSWRRVLKPGEVIVCLWQQQGRVGGANIQGVLSLRRSQLTAFHGYVAISHKFVQKVLFLHSNVRRWHKFRKGNSWWMERMNKPPAVQQAKTAVFFWYIDFFWCWFFFFWGVGAFLPFAVAARCESDSSDVSVSLIMMLAPC